MDAFFNNILISVPRPMILYLKNIKKQNPLVGIEIGVREGINAKSILENLNIQKLYLIDPSPESYKSVNERLKEYHNQISFFKKTSDDAIQDIKEEIDFVYIDGNHEYDYVKRDIENYFRKLKKNGVIGGHDFYGDFNGIIKAVMEFAIHNNLNVLSNKADWWIVKP